MSKKYSVAFPKQVPSFNPKRGKRGFKMICEHPKPRYSEQMESGVFCFVAPGKAHGKDMGFRVGLSQRIRKRSYQKAHKIRYLY
jgi:hypothetical protein